MNYFKISNNDMANGIGVRVVLWVSGCEHHCPQCQNPQTWDINHGIKFDDNAIDEIFKLLEKPYISGITYSGGDPLHSNNINEITSLSQKISEKFPHKTQWLYTGFTWETIKDLPLMKYIDVVIDGEYINNLRDITLAFRGSNNQRLIDVKKSLQESKVILWE